MKNVKVTMLSTAPVILGAALLLCGLMNTASAATGANCQGSVHEVKIGNGWGFLSLNCGNGPLCSPQAGCYVAVVPGTTTKFQCACNGQAPDGNCDATQVVTTGGSKGRCWGDCQPITLHCKEGSVIEYEWQGQEHRIYRCFCQ